MQVAAGAGAAPAVRRFLLDCRAAAADTRNGGTTRPHLPAPRPSHGASPPDRSLGSRPGAAADGRVGDRLPGDRVYCVALADPPLPSTPGAARGGRRVYARSAPVPDARPVDAARLGIQPGPAAGHRGAVPRATRQPGAAARPRPLPGPRRLPLRRLRPPGAWAEQRPAHELRLFREPGRRGGGRTHPAALAGPAVCRAGRVDGGGGALLRGGAQPLLRGADPGEPLPRPGQRLPAPRRRHLPGLVPPLPPRHHLGDRAPPGHAAAPDHPGGAPPEAGAAPRALHRGERRPTRTARRGAPPLRVLPRAARLPCRRGGRAQRRLREGRGGVREPDPGVPAAARRTRRRGHGAATWLMTWTAPGRSRRKVALPAGASTT